MRTTRILGLAIVAGLALAALVGPSGASATRLCKNGGNAFFECEAAYRYPVGTELTAHASGVVFTRSLSSDICGESNLKAKITDEGASNVTPVRLAVTSLTFSKCEPRIWTDPLLGSLVIEPHHNVLRDGIAFTEGMELQEEHSTPFGSATCDYSGWSVEPDSQIRLYHGSEPHLKLENVVLPRLGQPGCTETHLTAEYAISSPTPLNVTLH